jgi:hypothetical protein
MPGLLDLKIMRKGFTNPNVYNGCNGCSGETFTARIKVNVTIRMEHIGRIAQSFKQTAFPGSFSSTSLPCTFQPFFEGFTQQYPPPVPRIVLADPYLGGLDTISLSIIHRWGTTFDQTVIRFRKTHPRLGSFDLGGQTGRDVDVVTHLLRLPSCCREKNSTC